jgi:TatD DNase family protein
VRLLERFVQLAAELDKPIVLHAVYEDAEIACDLLEKHGVGQAHFHWFKGNCETLLRMKEKGYYLSVTPEVVYREKIREIVRMYPLELLMAETDGPWPFAGPFAGRRTHPSMIAESVAAIAAIKKCSVQEAGSALFDNTRRFYRLAETIGVRQT